MERLTRKDRNDSGTGVSKETLIDRERNGLSDYASRILTKLSDYEDAEEQGVLIRLPCKVGDMVYELNPFVKEFIRPMRVTKVVFTESYSRYSSVAIYAISIQDSGQYAFYAREINKTVFLTREEAEAALERMG